MKKPETNALNDDEATFLRPYDIDQIQKIVSRTRKNCDLEPNHTHFLLFDNGQPQYRLNEITRKREEIEHQLSINLSNKQSNFTWNNKTEIFTEFKQSKSRRNLQSLRTERLTDICFFHSILSNSNCYCTLWRYVHGTRTNLYIIEKRHTYCYR